MSKFNINYEDYFDLSDSNSERNLASAIISRAVHDFYRLGLPWSEKRMWSRQERYWLKHSVVWFRSYSEAEGSFIHYCKIVEINPENILKKLKIKRKKHILAIDKQSIV